MTTLRARNSLKKHFHRRGRGVTGLNAHGCGIQVAAQKGGQVMNDCLIVDRMGLYEAANGNSGRCCGAW